MRLPLLPLLLVTVLAACNGDGDEQVACPDAAVVDRISGLDLTADPVIETGGDVSCSFTAEDGITSVIVTTWGDPDPTMALLSDGVADIEPVELDAASDALWSPSTATLYASNGDRGVTVLVVDVTDLIADPYAVASDLAEHSLG